jgi:hypothetical protein
MANAVNLFWNEFIEPSLLSSKNMGEIRNELQQLFNQMEQIIQLNTNLNGFNAFLADNEFNPNFPPQQIENLNNVINQIEADLEAFPDILREIVDLMQGDFMTFLQKINNEFAKRQDPIPKATPPPIPQFNNPDGFRFGGIVRGGIKTIIGNKLFSKRVI